jgi:diguanylate cyclase (GGDEF)-like protein
MSAVFRVPPADTALYVVSPWFTRDFTLRVIGPGARRRTLTATDDLPGRFLGVRLPVDAWQADRIELTASTVSIAPPLLVGAETLGVYAWRSWWYAALFGLFGSLAVLAGLVAFVRRSARFAWLAGFGAAQAALVVPWLGLVRPPPSVSQPFHAVAQSVALVALAAFSLNLLGAALLPRWARRMLWALVALRAFMTAGSDLWQDLWPLNGVPVDAATDIVLALAFVALGMRALRARVGGAPAYLAGTGAAAAGALVGAFAADGTTLGAAAPRLGTAIEALLIALAAFQSSRDHAPGRPVQRPLLGDPNVDGVTAAANGLGLEAALARAWSTATIDRRPVAVLAVDLDNFARYNAACGHRAGDDVLRGVATALATVATEPHDLVARDGGDAFVVVLPNRNREGARRAGEAALAAITSLQIPHPAVPAQRVTASIGAASADPGAGEAVSGLLLRADSALSIAKAMGRNRVVTDEPEDAARAATRR